MTGARGIAIALGACVVLALAVFWLRGGSEGAGSGGGLTDSLVREALERELVGSLGRVTWDDVQLSADAFGATVSGLRVMPAESPPGASPRALFAATRLEVRADPDALRSGRLEVAEILLAEPVLYLPGALGSGRSFSLALRDLTLAVHSDGEETPELSGRGEFAEGGAVDLRLRRAEARDGRADAGAPVPSLVVEAELDDVPIEPFERVLPELEGATGRTSGRVLVRAIGANSIPGLPASVGRGVGSPGGDVEVSRIRGRFELDVTHVDLLVAEAYRKRAGDPATVSGRFTWTPDGEFQLDDVHVKVEKKAGDDGSGDTGESP